MASKEPKPRLSALDRALMAAAGDGRAVGVEGDPAREKFPALWEWLTKTGQDEGYVMVPASVAVSLGPEGVLVSVTHKDLGVTCSVACLHLEDCFKALEVALSSPNPPIRNWGRNEPNPKKRRKQS